MANLPNVTPAQQMISSCTGAIATSLLMTPFDVVKPGIPCKLIMCDGLMDFACVCSPDPKLELRGTWDAFVKISQRHGVSALWRGLTPTLVMSVPATVLYYTTYDQLRARLDQHMPQTVSPTLAGLSARMFASTVISPIELFRTKAQSLSAPRYSDIMKDIGAMVRQGGVRALWRGWVPTMWRDVPFSAIYWTVYEDLKRRLRAAGYTSDTPWDNFLVSFTSGAVAGSVSALVTTPFDVIKTYRQIDLTVEVAEEMGMKDTWRQITRQKGWQGLFAGVVPRVVKVAPACAIMVGSYEAGKTYFSEQNNRGTRKGPKPDLRAID